MGGHVRRFTLTPDRRRRGEVVGITSWSAAGLTDADLAAVEVRWALVLLPDGVVHRTDYVVPA